MPRVFIRFQNSILLAIFLLFLCQPAGYTQVVAKPVVTNQQGITIPFDYDPLLNPIPVIHIRINGSEPLAFLLDTGTSFPVIIDTWAAQKLNLTPNGQKMKIMSTGQKGDITTLKQFELVASLPGASQHALVPIDVAVAGIMDLNIPTSYASSEHIAGIFGVTIFQSVTACFDFVAKTVTLYPQPHPSLHLQDATVLPLKQMRGLYTVGLTDAEGGILDALIDTGNYGVTLPLNAVPHFHPTITPSVFRDTLMVDGLHVAKLLLLPVFKIGDSSEANIVVGAEADVPSNSEKTPAQNASLGMDYFKRFRMTLDIRHMQLLLEHASNYMEQSRMHGQTGINLMRSAGTYHVLAVTPASSAAEAGVQAGDVVLQVDGQPLTALPAGAAYNLLEGWADTPVELLVKRGEAKPMQVKFQRQTLFTLAGKQATATDIGFAVEHTDDKRLRVVLVARGSQAQQAGVTVDDELVMINDLAVATTSIEKLMAALSPQEDTLLTLQILHKGEAQPHEIKLTVHKLH